LVAAGQLGRLKYFTTMRGWKIALKIAFSIIVGIVQIWVVFYVLTSIKDSNTRLIVAALGLIYVAIVSPGAAIVFLSLELKGLMLELKQRLLADHKAELELQELNQFNQSLSIVFIISRIVFFVILVICLGGVFISLPP
jgi:hypothetical protein